jgi:hypothetical protein
MRDVSGKSTDFQCEYFFVFERECEIATSKGLWREIQSNLELKIFGLLVNKF